MGLLAAIVELIDDLIADITRIGRHVWQSPVPYLGFGFGAVIITWLLLGRADGGDFLSVAFWSADPEGMRNLLWSLATVAAGAAGLYGLSLAARRTKALDEQARIAEDNRQLSEQAQITERFTRAVEQLGHENRSVRLGGIYALERIAKDSDRDFETVMETLAAYVREQAPLGAEEAEMPVLPNSGKTPTVAGDITAALIVLTRTIDEEHGLRKSINRIDLRHTNLSGLDLPQSNFSGFDLSNARLAGAKLYRSDFSNCLLRGADFEGANLLEARLTNAFLIEASLVSALLDSADLANAWLNHSDLHNSTFRTACVTRTRFLNARNMSHDHLAQVLFDAPPRDVPDSVNVFW